MSLVATLPKGPLDFIADVHGEIGALETLLARLGYADGGRHPAGRRPVFLGDLTDRGPDSPAVLRRVRDLVQRDLAHCLLGNHELNLLHGLRKHGNAWFYEQPESLDGSGRIVPQRPADEALRREALDFFRALPLALERSDICAVHACWGAEEVETARAASNVDDLYREHRRAIGRRLKREPPADETQAALAHQNGNPVKILTSGPEALAEVPFYSSGRRRLEKRVAWWRQYAEPRVCVFGHYSRRLAPAPAGPDHVFQDDPPLDWLADGRAMCIDYGVAQRWRERLRDDFDGQHRFPLAALRWPERELVFDTGGGLVLEWVV